MGSKPPKSSKFFAHVSRRRPGGLSASHPKVNRRLAFESMQCRIPRISGCTRGSAPGPRPLIMYDGLSNAIDLSQTETPPQQDDRRFLHVPLAKSAFEPSIPSSATNKGCHKQRVNFTVRKRNMPHQNGRSSKSLRLPNLARFEPFVLAIVRFKNNGPLPVRWNVRLALTSGPYISEGS